MTSTPNPRVDSRGQDVLGRLDYLDELVARGDIPSKAALADTELARLVAAWRITLHQHRPTRRGYCCRCHHGLRRVRFPCDFWNVARQHLLPPDEPHGRHHQRAA
ncbi:hypothetical protein JOF53_000051 [Crossiella equi]|uniref:Uncharacterized protein n=1 Tax=Crossiella equi TaxID=130796 RepID=A0ABS5A3M9_9PSEU|nr:hypothetical protein [Crossiella equi]MBP2471179.1 hypothetical protein [Crossiella equi]